MDPDTGDPGTYHSPSRGQTEPRVQAPACSNWDSRSACVFNQSSSEASLLRTSSHGYPTLQLSFDPYLAHLDHLPSILVLAPLPS
ncbi:hypothetical protein CRENBAI_008499 [Crenichthys baileyi]|uniref:Uncharacterized protein n=1 Tax=Crenichthys baileyi TaxID=28760 RepID=A0AAV9R3N6_9TELE